MITGVYVIDFDSKKLTTMYAPMDYKVYELVLAGKEVSHAGIAIRRDNHFLPDDMACHQALCECRAGRISIADLKNTLLAAQIQRKLMRDIMDKLKS